MDYYHSTMPARQTTAASRQGREDGALAVTGRKFSGTSNWVRGNTHYRSEGKGWAGNYLVNVDEATQARKGDVEEQQHSSGPGYAGTASCSFSLLGCTVDGCFRVPLIVHSYPSPSESLNTDLTLPSERTHHPLSSCRQLDKQHPLLTFS
jgi:hypothetical protein